MDYVRKDSRGRWNSLDCLLAFGWCGSAVVGGFLLDRYGFDLTFIITASAQVWPRDKYLLKFRFHLSAHQGSLGQAQQLNTLAECMLTAQLCNAAGRRGADAHPAGVHPAEQCCQGAGARHPQKHLNNLCCNMPTTYLICLRQIRCRIG